METNQLELSFLSIFSLIVFFIFLILSKYSNRLKNGILLDKDFFKPQAFHQTAVSRSGGLAGIISLNILLIIYYLIYSKVLLEYLLVGNLMFLIGFVDDIRTKISPLKRLILMIFFLFILIYFFSIEISNIDIPFLSVLFNNNFISSIFVLLCFLFIINGANLIDGFNGLLAINLIIINSILAYINIYNGNIEISFFIIGQIIILLSFLLFNFPSAKMFFGDSGSYLMGSLVALNTIFTNNLNTDYSSFFFCILLFYLFFEVFFFIYKKNKSKKITYSPR